MAQIHVRRAPVTPDADHTEHGLAGLIRRLESAGETIISVSPHDDEWVIVSREADGVFIP